MAIVGRGRAFWTAAGIVLALLAGYMPEATYQHLLSTVGRQKSLS